MTDRADLPSLDDIPIPPDVVPDSSWSARMLEMADHIGPYATLRIVEAFGGEKRYITADPLKNPFRELIGDEAAAILSQVYRREYYSVPVCGTALRRARRAGVLAAVRDKSITAADAARILRTSRTYLSYLVNQTSEGNNVVPFTPRIRTRVDPRQLDIFACDPEADKNG